MSVTSTTTVHVLNRLAQAVPAPSRASTKEAYPDLLFLTTAKQGVREEQEASQQRSDIVPEQRKDELWSSYLAGIKGFRSHPTIEGLEQLALRYGRWLYWEERESFQWGPQLAELGADIRAVLLDKGIIEEFEELTEGLSLASPFPRHP